MFTLLFIIEVLSTLIFLLITTSSFSTSFFYKNPEKFNIKNVSPKNKINFERINLCVDNDKDLERAIWISDQMIQNNDNCYNIEEIIALAREWEENFSRLGKD